MPVVVPEVPIQVLARTPPELAMSVEEADRIAALAFEIGRAAAERTGVPDLNWVPYQERTASQRAAMRAAVVRVVQALVLLGWIEHP